MTPSHENKDKYKLLNRFYICKFHHVNKELKSFNYEHLEAINIVNEHNSLFMTGYMVCK